MKRRILGLTVAFLFVGFNLFAADGDLIVEGNLGVGTQTPPQYPVDVISSANGVIRFSSSEADATVKAGRVVVRHYSNSQLPVYVFGSASTSTDNFVAFGGGNALGNAATKLDFFTASNNTTAVGTSRISVLGNGNVGIANTNPSTYLLTMEASGGGYYNQSTHSWVDASSGRWKSSIQPITGALDTVLKLNGVSFTWKKRTDLFETNPDGEKNYISSSWGENPNGKKDIGLIGEEVMKVLPEVVDVDENDSKFVTGVSYSKIVPLLIEAIKEQQKEIDVLKLELSTIKK